jgi:ABC-type lipoprotein export system ATPase subunit
VEVSGKELSKMNDDQLTIFRRRNIGFVFQNYNLVPILNVYKHCPAHRTGWRKAGQSLPRQDCENAWTDRKAEQSAE